MEKKIVSLIGLEYTFGSDCPDSMPEEETLQHEMEAGMDMVEVISLSQCNEYKLLETEKDQALPAPQIIASGSRATAVASPTNQQDQEVTLQSAAPQITVSGSRAAAVITSPPTVQRKRPRRIRNLNPRHSVAEQANMARQDFLAVAESNAEAIRMLAVATEVQAAAAKMQAEAAKVQAEASLSLAQAANKIADAFILYINKNNK
ncbi:unnamed protein product [Parnassius mnemosyne]|uniref:Uncharacterized protein n=1 Tax=Parnassius mnemosyne TaxID=213953 RepID=A0AAV1MAM4_9NEOP